MRYLIIFLSIFIFSISLTFSIQAKKLSKKNSEYTGKAIVEYDTMFNAGGWFMIMLQCEGTFAKTYKKKLEILKKKV